MKKKAKRTIRPTRARRKKQHAAAVSKALKKIARVPTEPPPAVTVPNGEKIRPSHWRYAHTKLEMIEKGEAPTVVRIAKALHIDRCTLYEFLRRWPWLDEWVNAIARDAAVQMHGLILKRHGLLAIQGSVQSADLYCKMDGGFYARAGGGLADGNVAAGAGAGVTVTNNFLVPRPDYAGALAAPVPALPAAPVSKIPVVNVR